MNDRPKAQYQYSETVGIIESVTAKMSPNNRAFHDTRINGKEYTIWDDFLAQQADNYRQEGATVKAQIRAKVDEQGRVSKFWQMTAIEPMDAAAEVNGTPAPPTNGSIPIVQSQATYTRLSNTERIKILELAVIALSKTDAVNDPNTIINLATALEAHVVDNS